MSSEYPSLSYPEDVRSLLLETDNLIFSDGTVITADQIWEYMTVIGPKRLSYAFSTNPSFANRLSEDVYLISGIRRNYLNLTGIDRLRTFVKKKIPIVLIQGGITVDLYRACGCIPVGSLFIRNWILNSEEGREYTNANLKTGSLLEEARQNLSHECCNLIANIGLLKTRNLPISAITPILNSRCSDMAYAVEAYRSESDKIPTYLIDYPVNYEWGDGRIEYLQDELHCLADGLCRISGKEVSDEDLRREIALENKTRALVRECRKIWWSGKVPPTNSIDGTFVNLGIMGGFDFPVANQILKETRDELQVRVRDGVKGFGLADDPTRIFICGSCATPNPYFIDMKGGVIVGSDDIWSTLCCDIEESGDPYENLARSYAALPYERSTEERAHWIIEQIKESRTDGVVFMYNWGCNYQSAISAMITDIIREETGIPAIGIEVGELARMESLEQSQNRIESFIEMLQ